MNPDPGQIITPGGDDSSGQPQQPSDQQQEMAASISHEPKLPEPAPMQQAPEPKLPEPQGDSLAAQTPVAPQQSQPEQPYVQPAQPPQQPLAAPEPSQAAPLAPFQQTAVTQDEYQQFQQSDATDQEQYDDEAISWTASEYIAHHKPSSWFVLLACGAVVVTVFVYFLTDGDIISTIAIPLVALIFGMYAYRKPHEQQYVLSNEGVGIGARTYHFSELKSFAIVDEGPFASIVFLPMKRFMPLLSIYYDPQDEEHIVEFLAARLPMEQRGHDAIDRLMKKIRF